MGGLANSTKLSQAGLGFLQRRVSLFGLVVGGLGLIFLVFRVVDALWNDHYQELEDPSLHAHLAAVLLFTGMWALCRSGTRSRRFIHIVESVGFIGGSIAYQIMGGQLPLEERPEYLVLLALTYGLVARAAFVPSSAVRTLAVGAAIGISLVVTTYVSNLRVDATQLASASAEFGFEVQPEQYAARLAGFVALFWILTTILATSINQVVHGLRKDARDAQRLGQYVLEEKLGEGGMGVVYRASHAMLRRPTAVKLLRPGQAGEQALLRFEREVQLTAELSHPNTVSIHDFGRTRDGVFYYAMEYLDGIDLQRLVDEDGAQLPERVIHILRQVLGALGEAHGVGLIHRDIKPGNIILCERGGVPDVAKVVDFGLVKELDTADGLSREGALVGTPLYMAPEAIRSGAADPRSDIYAVGAVGYYLLTGCHVFTGQTVMEICGHHLHTQPVSPSERIGHDLPPDLETWVMRCLEKAPESRPGSAVEAAEELGAAYDVSWDVGRARDWWQTSGGNFKQVSTRGPSPGTIAVDLARIRQPR